MDELGDELRIENPEEYIRQEFERNPDSPWDMVVDITHSRRVLEASKKIVAKVQEAVFTLVTESEKEEE